MTNAETGEKDEIYLHHTEVAHTFSVFKMVIKECTVGDCNLKPDREKYFNDIMVVSSQMGEFINW